MDDQPIEGARVRAWLQSRPDQAPLLIGAGIDDGDSEDLWIVEGIEGERLVLTPEGGGPRLSRGVRWLDTTTLAAPPDHPAVGAILAARSPEQARLDDLRDWLRPHLRPYDINDADLPRLKQAILDADAGVLPDRGARHDRADLFLRAGQQRLGARIVEGWRTASQARDGKAAGDIVIRLAKLLRDSGEKRAAAQLIEDYLRPPLPPAVQKMILLTELAAVRLDLFEDRRRRDPDLLERARAAAGQAYAILKGLGNGRETSEELSHVYGRIERLEQDRLG